MNIANKVTVSRFILSIVYFVLLYLAERDNFDKTILYGGLIVFIIAALTDSLDGYLARRYKIITKFGRIVDPFADKILICGSFIFLATWEPLRQFLSGWMVLVIVVREFSLHGLRVIAEAQQIPFASTVWGKCKTTTQCITIIWLLFYLVYFRGTANEWWAVVIGQSLIWLTLFSTVFSAVIYFYQIRKMLKQVVEE
ncbi:MAG: CDP-diacylglycerol--glycerol-3-phosphate 3-phosphatidyltransferase [Planctomycetota bacterium]|nr:CDP-diacylglycerol--glycerol-3-phosphate 3-phosphatidyltransferase [Planctomycetota bacterium]MDI6787292.1 CDP-diacylglycerol--glycerol-3-phosphate 3-phosphatidyltransferase [Planctomycetota bacterium]